MNVAIIAAAGQGTRMAGSRPKQFLELAGTPILIRTLQVFERCDVIQEIIVVVPTAELEGFARLSADYEIRKLAKIVAGGSTRAESVGNGIQEVRETTEIVAIHDGVRPFVTTEEIEATISAAKLEGAAILVSRPVDTIKQVNGGRVIATLDREHLRNALTPQSFRYELLRRAYQQIDVLDPSLTDESSIVEKLNVQVAVVEGSHRNMKITREEDMVLAEAMLMHMNSGL